MSFFKQVEFKQGDKLVCLGNRNYEHLLPENVVYTAVYDLEEGIFPDRPFITVTAEHLKEPVSSHASRFVLWDGEQPPTSAQLEQLREQQRRGLYE
jgi:hypothetical protein